MDWNGLTLFFYIFMRMTGFLLFSPLFGRTGIPRLWITAFGMLLSLSAYAACTQTAAVPDTALELAVRLGAEVFYGALLGMTMRFFFYVAEQAGEMVDTQMGLSMARTYDPSSQASSTVTATTLGNLMLMLFVVGNGHITLLRVMLTSGDLIPFGSAALSPRAADHAVLLFAECALMAVKMGLPILGAELLGQMGMGVLMKAIPQINVFALNIELKIIVGLSLVIALMPALAAFLLETESYMLRELEQLLLIAAEG